MSKTKTKVKEEEYDIQVNVAGKVYRTFGKTILEGLAKLKPDYFGKGYATFEVGYKGRKSKVPIKVFPIKLQRIFTKPDELSMFAKRLQILL